MANPYIKQTWADGSGGGTPVSAARLAVIEQGIFDAHYQPAVRVFHNATQSITSATATALAFNSERFDQASGLASAHHDTVTNNSRLTCLYAGVYEIIGSAAWASNPTTASIRIRLGGTTNIAWHEIEGDYRNMFVSTHYSLAVNDYVELVVSQTSGGAININSSVNYSPEFSMIKVA